MRTKLSRTEIVTLLIERDGLACQYPGCDEILDLNDVGPKEVTIDHSEPISWCRENGWTEDEIWDLSNLKLFSKKCNARKSNIRYLPDGTLPEPKGSRFRLRRQKRAERPDTCDTCMNGRILLIGEECPVCFSGPQPSYPTAYQCKSSECPHSGPWSCWACMIGIAEREPAIVTVLDGGMME